MRPPDERVLPKSVKLLWELDNGGTRGPKRGLSLAQILDTAIAIADAEGFAALSMARVAKELGFTTMSLYRYVDSKDTLVELLHDRIFDVRPDLPEGDWRAAMEAWAWAEFQTIRAHDWWLDIPVSGPPLGPNNMIWLEAGMNALSGLAIPEPLRLQLLLNLSIYVIGRTRFLRDAIQHSKAEQDFTAILMSVLDPQRFPAVTSALTSNAFDDDDINWEEADFGFALARLLDGYQVFIDSLGDVNPA
ncbi:TetR/AcrR family transcriptional regulator [Nocardia yunnanensis]|uniref:TetR/AcrR family transcriptional regulator n=1 Tax=Nocardia yunnanensis TaxID=2382165 RepID=A0A386ZJR9_9NOCA|nr:TetR/AcrR family transcriptional regulator [Nocardia yunnanensis]AYF77676.1 TetR/AcrR family transcriptional regulator [Nocardia yunnanensis]